ncbi:DNA polymerase III subunit gamma/tau [Sphingomonas sp.]|uniref:DNA polymerase III subunit gamma/tau n=1 Tax=Sphingomonas sp. TaxID=28214 RepID=UPI00286A9360|nr:DNA polymerase III subunit gamma/tau [Sphingomonas sp.]
MSDSPSPADEPGLGLDLPAVAPPSKASPYRVLARKYRPQSFDELIGQDAMVTTLGNAIERGRIAHAFLLTGVRGVGKTSTARLIAKALNCIGPDGSGGPTIAPCGLCEPCVAIAEGRHIDVIEMDAASHTGVDDVREIIEAVRYSSVSARYKIYIIDEVHMLSKSAFNALLKTLEEPPEHVKFIFATTEVGKVPVTVLSRCQRFDLRRIPAELLAAHFAKVAEKEGVAVEEEAVQVIARAAEGSARDGLSILDQAIAHGEGRVHASDVRAMLGLADRGRTRRMLASLLAGDAAATLTQLDEAHSLGIDPASLIRGLMESVHAVTRAKAGATGDVLQSAEEREAAAEWAGKLGWASIHRLWQLLLKGLQDVGVAPDPSEAAAMALLRVVHAADLPDPATLLARLSSGQGAVAAPSAGSAPPSPPAPTASASPVTFNDLIDRIEQLGRRILALQLRDQVGLVSFAPGEIVLRPLRPLGPDFPRELAASAKEVTGSTWSVSFTDAGGEPSLQQQEQMAEEKMRAAVLEEPNVRALIDAFPDATLESISLTKGA